MAVVPAAPPLPRREPFQFSLSGMLLTFCLVLSIGLGYWRWKGVTFWGAMLLSFAIWVTIGLVQRVRDLARRSVKVNEMPRDERYGLLLEAALPLWCIALLLVVTCSEISVRYGMFGPGWQTWLTDILFYLAIIGAYWQPALKVEAMSRRSRVATLLFSLVLMVVGIWWLAEIIAGETEVFRMVHAAIRNIERSQPTTFAGRPFTQSRLTLSREELQQMVRPLGVSSLALLVAMATSAVLVYRWPSMLRVRWALFALWIFCIVIAAAGMGICWGIGTGDLSPLHIPQVYELRWNQLALLSIVAFTLPVAAGLHVSATAKAKLNLDYDLVEKKVIPLYERAGVMMFGLCAVLGKFGYSFWQNAVAANSVPVESWILDPQIVWRTVSRLCVEYAVHLPTTMIGIAAAAVLARCLWRASNRPTDTTVWLLEPDRFAVSSIIALVMLATVTPVAVWWDVVLMLLR